MRPIYSQRLFLGAFFDQLERWAYTTLLVSPQVRSTPLATAYELSRRFPDRLRLFKWTWTKARRRVLRIGAGEGEWATGGRHLHIRHRGGELLPAVLGGRSSRAAHHADGRPSSATARLGRAANVPDQLNAYGSHVRAFRNMPEPAADAAAIAFARQAAREARIAAGGEAAGRATDGEGAPRIAGASASGPCTSTSRSTNRSSPTCGSKGCSKPAEAR